jgi:hypothetical protein
VLLLRGYGHVFVFRHVGFETPHGYTRLEVPQAKHPVGAARDNVAAVPELKATFQCRRSRLFE